MRRGGAARGRQVMVLCVVHFQAGDLAIKFLDPQKAQVVVEIVGPRLAEIHKHGSVSILEALQPLQFLLQTVSVWFKYDSRV